MNCIMNHVQKWIQLCKEYSQSPEGKIAGEIAGGILEIGTPYAGLLFSSFKTIAEEADKIKLENILIGLADGLNMETRLNELYSFVKTPERAFLVANTFRQALLSHSQVVCCIYGLILSDCIRDNRDTSYEELIVYNALQTATDYEMLYIKEIFDKYLDGNDVDEKRISKQAEFEYYKMTIDWCKSNRILSVSSGVRSGGGFDVVGDYLVINSCTQKLIEYINRAHQIIRMRY